MKAESGACLSLEMWIWKKWVTCPVGRCNCFRPATNQNPAYFFSTVIRKQFKRHVSCACQRLKNRHSTWN
jgi:hypothetical protein